MLTLPGIFGSLAAFVCLLCASPSREVIVDPKQPPPPMDGGLRDGEFALTFDDGPDPLGTPKILAALRKHGVKATFFQVGIKSEAMADLTRAVLRDGHTLGSHSWDHVDLTTIPLAEAIANIQRGHKAVEGAVGGDFHTPFFRFPYFNWNDDLVAAVRAAGLTHFHANVVTEDYATPDPDQLLKNALAMLEHERHGIILFHENQQQSAQIIDDFLTGLEARGFHTAVFRAP